MSNPANTEWVEKNLQRQRKMLEDKQRQKRLQSAGGVRPNLAGFGGSGYPQNNFKPDLSLIEDPPSYAVEPDNMNPTVVTVPAPKASPIPAPPSKPPVKNLIDFEDDLSHTLSKANVKEVVGSDVDSPNGSDLEEHTLSSENQPNTEEIKKDPIKFVSSPGLHNTLYKCTITRDKKGVDKGIYPTYYLHLEYMDMEEKKKIFLLAARKRKKSTTANYLISTDVTDMGRDSANFIAKVRSNALGTHFTVYDKGVNPKKNGDPLTVRQELAAVIYDTNVLGFKGPRKMTIVTPGVLPKNGANNGPPQQMIFRPIVEKDTLLERYKARNTSDLIIMNNKSPIWNEDSQSYVLNFHGRVTQASVKNFQIAHDQDPNYIVLQFGRISDEEFTMDYRYPLSAIQAFGIAMTSFHGKLACE